MLPSGQAWEVPLGWGAFKVCEREENIERKSVRERLWLSPMRVYVFVSMLPTRAFPFLYLIACISFPLLELWDSMYRVSPKP